MAGTHSCALPITNVGSGLKRRELAAPEQRERLQSLLAAAGKRLTLVYGAKDEKHNQALVLRDLLSRMARRD